MQAAPRMNHAELLVGFRTSQKRHQKLQLVSSFNNDMDMNENIPGLNNIIVLLQSEMSEVCRKAPYSRMHALPGGKIQTYML